MSYERPDQNHERLGMSKSKTFTVVKIPYTVPKPISETFVTYDSACLSLLRGLENGIVGCGYRCVYMVNDHYNTIVCKIGEIG